MKRLSPIAAISLAALALACGVPKKEHETTVAALKKAQEKAEGDLKTCQADRDAAQARVAALEGDLTSTKGEREKTAAELASSKSDLKATTAELEELRRQRAEAEKRLEAFKKLTEKFQAMIDSGKLKVRIRGGRMVVELPAGILFDSGKATLSKEGKAAIAEVAGILQGLSDRRFLVAGHTDNEKIRTGKFRDNWDLSSARALTVTKFLIESGVTPGTLSAAGYGEFDPVADNGTEEGKQKNRRIEIILLPNIEEIPGMPEDTK
jgi:chemotaxis protein MotB